ncbi:hypothetical protein HMPREF1869_01390 [Bacteroidales bacterium KA00251]|nr:hypothetical protein HMPREF1869_01390 [Bacteroidales bacterium KA00251]
MLWIIFIAPRQKKTHHLSKFVPLSLYKIEKCEKVAVTFSLKSTGRFFLNLFDVPIK